MHLTRLATLASLPLVALVAAALGGVLGAGAFLGWLLGAGVSLAGVERQRVVTREKPESLMAVFALAFLAKLALLAVGALALRHVDALAARFDWQAFLIAYAAAVFAVTLFGAVGQQKLLSAGRAAASNEPPTVSTRAS